MGLAETARNNPLRSNPRQYCLSTVSGNFISFHHISSAGCPSGAPETNLSHGFRIAEQKTAAEKETTMARIHLNAKKVESLQPGSKRIQVFDKSQPNLAIRIATSGVKSWSVVYKWNGRMKRLTLGTYPAVSLADARNRAFDALRNVARGDDPQAEKISVREAGTFAELAQQYMDEWAKINKRSWREDQRKFDVYLLPKWKHSRASSITIDDVELLLEQLALRAPIQANRVRALIRHVYAWALAKRTRRKKYVLENNPCAFVPKLAKERARDRVYSDDELKALWKAFGTIGVTGDLFKPQLLTAARPGEVSEMDWNELDLTRAIWTQPSARTKKPEGAYRSAEQTGRADSRSSTEASGKIEK